MIPLAVPNLTGNERKYLNKCIDTTFVSSVGEFVNRIEEMTAKLCGAKYGVATSSGTTGLHLALTGCGVKRDELVIIPTFTFIATANAVAHCGAVPWLLDISADSWNLDISQLEKELKEITVKSANSPIFFDLYSAPIEAAASAITGNRKSLAILLILSISGTFPKV